MRMIGMIALVCMILSAGGVSSAAPPVSPPATGARPARAEVLALGSKVADWQLAHMDRFDYTRTHLHSTVEPLGWIQGTLYSGLATFAERSGEPRFSKAVRDHGVAQAW